MYTENIDWSVHEKYSENTCYCNCGHIFKSHSKYVGKIGKSISQKLCSNCGENDNLWKASSDKESYIF